MKVRIKKLDKNAIIPAYAHNTDAGIDLTCVSVSFDQHNNITYHTGLAFEIPEGYVGLLFPRSSVYKHNIVMSNSVGVIDSGYRGEVMFKYKYLSDDLKTTNDCFKIGDRVGQLIILPYPHIELEEVDELSESDRGEKGFGSTGK